MPHILQCDSCGASEFRWYFKLIDGTGSSVRVMPACN